MLRLTIILVALLLQSGTAFAATCAGRDVWPTTSPAVKARIQRILSNDPFATGRFFEVTKNGKTSYLFGTMHSPTAGKLRLPSHVKKMLQGARVLMVEVSNDQEKAFYKDKSNLARMVVSKKSTNFIKHFQKSDLPFVLAVGKAAKMKPATLDHVQPWFFYVLASSVGCGPPRGTRPIMDAYIESLAENARIPVVGLETPRQALKAFQGFSAQDYALMIGAEYHAIKKQRPGDRSATMTAMYIRGDIQAIWQWQNMNYAGANRRGVALIEKLWRDKLLVQRNRSWMPAILRETEKGGAFVAVGAMHLGGEGGLMKALQRKGYQIQPIVFKFN